MKHKKYGEAELNLKKLQIEKKDDNEPIIHNWIGLDFGQKNTVAACKINFLQPNERENLVITQKSLKKCIIDHSKYVNGEKIKKNIFKDEEPIVKHEYESLIDFWKRKMSRYDKLSQFYNSSKMKRRRWFRQRSFQGIFDEAINKIIEMAGNDKNGVMLVLGDGKFTSENSLHSSFERRLIKKLIGLGYKVGVVDEAYTSCKCCRCHCFVQFVSMRIKYCPQCDTYFHRDVLGAENIIHAGRGVWLFGSKPKYLPKWKEKKNDNDEIQEVKDPPIKKIKINI